MIKIEDIQKEINALSKDDFKKLRDWIIEREWGYWDQEIKKDSENGKLDFLIEEAQDAKYKNKLSNL
ncbi:MAG: hypothetical protein FJY07_01940 [Bacteroidetes bacterium]|nr:hypothetical protein [Bacteroidota bacterium]